jgi:serine phosphatase RsbU (regulator of sigma subunit)
MLQHPNIARALQTGLHQGRLYFAMDFIDGRSLKETLGVSRAVPTRSATAKRAGVTLNLTGVMPTEQSPDQGSEPHSLAESVHIVRQVCAGLAYAHAKGVVHRDIKPDNIIVGVDGIVRIIDFGLAALRDDEHLGMTRPGAVMGTPYYMSPEQMVDSSTVDERSDIYAVGVVLYELISGRLPTGLVSLELVPAELASIISRCIAYDRHDRFDSVDAVIAALDAYAAGGLDDDHRALVRVEESARLRDVMIRTLFPTHAPNIDGFGLATLHLPAAGVGGNYYDFIEVGGGRVGILVGNVAMRPSVESAIFLATVRSAFRLCAAGESDPARALARTNTFIANEGFDSFAVFSYGVLDPARRTLTLASAGFRPAGLLRAGAASVEYVNSPGLGLGIVDDADYSSVEVTLGPNDVVIFTTTGVVKTGNLQGEAYGQSRLEAAIQANRGKASHLVEALRTEIMRYSAGVAQADDMTVIALRAHDAN